MFQPITISPASLRQICEICHPMRDTGESKFTLQGVFFDFEDHDLQVVGTDGRAMAISATNVNASERHASDNRIIDLTKLFAKRRSLRLTEHKPDVKMAESADRESMCFDWRSGKKHFHVECPILEGRFPNWRACVPKESDSVATIHVERERWVEMIENSLPRPFGHTLTLSNDFQVTATTPEPQSVVLPTKLGGDKMPETHLDLDLLGSHLGRLTATSVTMDFFGKEKPVLVSTMTTRFVQMPIAQHKNRKGES